MATKLAQALAVHTGHKTQTEKFLTELHHKTQKPALQLGLARTYSPNQEDGEQLPSEFNKVQVNLNDELNNLATTLSTWYDSTATVDHSNAVAKGNVVVDGKVLLEGVPSVHLLFLEKRLIDLRTFVEKLPTLDPSETWNLDSSDGLWKTQPVETLRTKKIPRNHVKAEATDKHPAQVEVYMEDVPVGRWKVVKASGSLSLQRRTEILSRISKLYDAVKFAREEANGVQAVEIKDEGKKIFNYLLGS